MEKTKINSEKPKINGEKLRINGNCNPIQFFNAVFGLPSFDLSNLKKNSSISRQILDSNHCKMDQNTIDASHITYSPKFSFPNNLPQRSSIRCRRENSGIVSSEIREVVL